MVGKVTPDTMLSASRLPGVLGLSKYQTPNDELECSIRAIQGHEREDIGKEAMGWGNAIEPLILQEAARRLQLSDLVTEHPKARYHAAVPLCCSLDGTGDGRGQVITSDVDAGIYVIGQESIQLDGVGVLEAKLTGMDVEDSPPLWRGPLQLQAQMDIVGAKWGAICTLYRGIEMRIFVFAPHQQTVDLICQTATDFQSRLDRYKATGEIDYYPPADGEKWPDRRGLYPVDDIYPIELNSDAAYLASKILTGKKDIKTLEDDVAKYEKDLKKMMGEHTVGKAGSFQILWPTRSYKAQPEKIVAAKEAYTIRQSTLSIKEITA